MRACPQKARNRPDLTRFYPPFIVLGPSGGGKVPPGGLNQSLPVSLNPQTSLEPGELPDTPIKTDLDVSFPHQGHIKQVHQTFTYCSVLIHFELLWLGFLKTYWQADRTTDIKEPPKITFPK